MRLIFSGEPYPQNVEKMIFLAGSRAHRGQWGSSWRVDAIKWLTDLGFDGVIFVPEDNLEYVNKTSLDDEVRARWERGAMTRSDVIVFWPAADSQTSQDITMSIELGWLIESGRIVLGIPPEIKEVGLLQYYAKQLHIPRHTTLTEVIREAVNSIGVGAKRQGGESAVPLNVWRTESFQQWLTAQKKVGNRLDDAHVEWVGRVGPSGSIVFFWIMYVKVWVQDEDRYKENEWVIGRPDISSILLYMPHPTDPMETKIVLVKEYRSPASNSQAKIYELPGGSTFKSGVNPYALAMQELQEETGFTLNKDHQLRSHVPRQLNGTLSTHKCRLFSLELTPKEVSNIEAAVGKTFGNSEDTEQTTLVIMTLREMLRVDFADYATLGMIMQALADNRVLW